MIISTLGCVSLIPNANLKNVKKIHFQVFYVAPLNSFSPKKTMQYNRTPTFQYSDHLKFSNHSTEYLRRNYVILYLFKMKICINILNFFRYSSFPIIVQSLKNRLLFCFIGIEPRPLV